MILKSEATILHTVCFLAQCTIGLDMHTQGFNSNNSNSLSLVQAKWLWKTLKSSECKEVVWLNVKCESSETAVLCPAGHLCRREQNSPGSAVLSRPRSHSSKHSVPLLLRQWPLCTGTQRSRSWRAHGGCRAQGCRPVKGTGTAGHRGAGQSRARPPQGHKHICSPGT